MTEYTDLVDRARLEQEAEKWAEGGAYLHLNKGVIKRKYLNGDIDYLDCKTEKQWKVFKNLPTQTLIDRFRRRNRGHG